MYLAKSPAHVNFLTELNQLGRVICCILISYVALMLSGCAGHHAYVSLTPPEEMRDVTIPIGAVALIRSASGGSAIVGLDYEQSSDHIFARVLPGTTLREVERSSGNIIRSFPAQKVVPGCGGITPIEIPTVACGLAMRWSDRHFFLDNPTGNPITEVDFNGDFVRHITLQQPGGVIGGLAYDQQTNHLYVLYIATETVAEVDLNGVEIRRFRPQPRVLPQGLGMSSDRRELYMPLFNGDFLGVFDLGGALITQYPLQRSGVVGGVGAGRRPWWR
jgi:hypothetical protein